MVIAFSTKAIISAKKTILKKKSTTAINAIIQLIKKAIWEDIRKFTQGKNHTSATNATTHLIINGVWTVMWKLTIKRYSNAKIALLAANGSTTYSYTTKKSTRRYQQILLLNSMGKYPIAQTVTTKVRVITT